MRTYKKAKDKNKPTKPKVARSPRKPAQPLDPTQQQVSTHVAETLTAVQAAVNTPQVQAALSSGNINTATDSFPWEVFDQKLSALAGPLEELVRRSLIIPHLMPKRAVIQTNFNHLDPRVTHAARTMSSKLATSMSAEQYSKVRTIIGNGVAKGDTVKQISQALRAHIGLNARQDRTMSTAVLDATQEAIDAGLTGDAIGEYVSNATDSLYAKMIRYRGDLIARTETMAAQNTGFMLGVQQAVEDPTSPVDNTWSKRWIAADDERTCPICGALDGTEIPIDEDFETDDGDTISYPLADGSSPHPQCRCTVGLVPPNRDIAGLASGDTSDSTDATADIPDMASIESSLRPSREIIDMALAMFNKTYDPEEPRDDHGKWTSDGGESGGHTVAVGKDITKEMGDYLGHNSDEFLTKTEARDRISALYEKNDGDQTLALIAQKQGFDGLPEVVSADEMKAFAKDPNYVIAYRGIAGAQADQYAERFRTGDYYAGHGTVANGIYFAANKQVAQDYAGPIGSVLQVAIPVDQLISPDEFQKATVDTWTATQIGGQQGSYPFYGSEDVGRTLAAKGVGGASAVFNLGDKVNQQIYIVWNRSMLKVANG